MLGKYQTSCLGVLAGPDGGVSDFTAQYVKRHGKPVVGQRVFIRTRQYPECGHDEFPETGAVVPAQEAGGGPATEVQLLRNTYGNPTEMLRSNTVAPRWRFQGSAVGAGEEKCVYMG